MILILLSLQIQASQGLTYQGKILKADGTPMTGAAIQFQISVLSPGAERCLLYQETQSANLTSTNGTFAFSVGTGTRVAANVDAGHSFMSIFSNRFVFDQSAAPSACSVGTSYTPALTDHRILQVSFFDGTSWQMLPDQPINQAPNAIEAQQVGGYAANQIIRVDASTSTANTEMSSVQFARFLDLMNLTLTNNQYPAWDTSTVSWKAVTPSGGSPSGAAGGDLSGTYPNPTVANVGAVTAANVASGATLANGATNVNTASTIVKRDASGNFTAGTITANLTGTATNFSGSLTGDVTGTQGATLITGLARSKLAAGTVGQVLVNDGAGLMSGVSMTNGQLLIGSTGLSPVAASLTAGSGITITPGAGSLSIAATGSASQWTTTGSDIYYNTGNVGIGTASPNAGLHITKNGAASTASVKLDGAWFSGGTSTTTKPAFLIEPAGTTSTAWSTFGTGIGLNAPNGFTGNLVDYKTNNNNMFNISAYGDGSFTGNIIVSNNGSGNQGTIMVGPPAVQNVANDKLSELIARGTNSTWGTFTATNLKTVVTTVTAGAESATMTLQTVSAGTLADRITIGSTGNVGIGTTSPAAKLEVNDTGTTSSAIIVPRAGNFTGTNVNGMIRYNTSSTLFEFRQNGSWVNYTTVSDGRLKTNVVPVVKGLDIVNQLRPVFYDWDRSNPKASSFEDKHQLGFIAQDVEKVLPEVVNQGEDSYRSLEYGKMVAVVVAAVKELYQKVLNVDREIASMKAQKADKAEVDQWQALNADLKNRLSKAEQENAAIKSWLCAKDPQANICR